MSIELGDKVKDSVTGFVGIAVGRTKWLHGCERISVQPLVDKDGKCPEVMAFDAPQLIVVKAGVAKQGDPKKGGPRPAVFQRSVKRY